MLSITTSIILTSIILLISNRNTKFKKIDIYLLILIIYIIISKSIEQKIYQNFPEIWIVLIFNIEIILNLILLTLLFIIINKNHQSDYFIYIHSFTTLLSFHIIVAGIFGLLFIGNIIIGFSAILVCCIIIPFDKESKIIFTIAILGVFIYASLIINELFLALFLLGLILFIISFGYESFRNKKFLILPISIFLSILSPLRKNKPENLIGKNKKIVRYWETRIKILQGASDKKDSQQEQKIGKATWFQDFFSNKSCYGLEIALQNDFTWTFLLKERSQSKAKINGEALLTRLSSIYPGIDGEIKITPYTKKQIQNEMNWEIKIPKSPYFEKISLISDFINLFHRNKQKITLYVIWKSVSTNEVEKIRRKIGNIYYKDRNEEERLLKMWQDNLFKVRIFVSCELREKIEESETLAIKGIIKSLTMSTKKSKNSLYLRRIPALKLSNIFKLILTSKQYILPKCIDFDFSKAIPLIKPFSIEEDNIKLIPFRENNPDFITIGRYIFKGIKTERKIPIPIKHFAQSAVIFGQMGSGKTYLLAQIVKEFYDKAPNIGMLIINLGKADQESFYELDKILKFGSPEFHIPYYVQGIYLEKSLQETAAYLIAALGLKNIVEKNMLNVMKIFLNKEGKLPDSLDILFYNLLRYFKQFPYHNEFQTNILRALQNRVITILSDFNVKQALQLNSHIPKWFQEWRNGKKIYLDLSMCNIYVKRLLTNALFQLVRTLIPDVEAGSLQNIIIIDEAHQILEKPINNNYDDDDFISREQLEKVFSELLREFRSKGLSFMIADQTPSRLFESVYTLPSLKILFRLGYPCNTIFTGNNKEQDYLSLQKNRQALVLNGINGEKYVVETLDFMVQKKLRYPEKTIKISNCPYCKSLIDHKAKYCNYCENPLLADLPKPPKEMLLDFFDNKESEKS
ncbi:MAG: ATP-binding protein [Promethearchaeota archaeon]